MVLVAAVTLALVRAQGGEEGLRLSVGEVARMAPDSGVTAGEPAVGAGAGRAAAGPAPEPGRPARTARRRGAARPATASTGTPAKAAPAPAPAVRVVGQAGPPQRGRPLPTPGDHEVDQAPVAPPAGAPAATPTPAPTPAPAKRTYAVDRTDVRMSPLNGEGAVRRGIERYRPLPSAARPYATYLGRVAGTARAAFVVTPGTSVLGGDCRPSRTQCAVVTVPAGRHAWIGFSDGMAWRLDVLAVDRVGVASRAAARVARTRYSTDGACVLSRLNVLPGSLQDLGVRLQVPLSAREVACPAG